MTESQRGQQVTYKEYKDMLQRASNRENWTPELFEQCRRSLSERPECFSNDLRKRLPESVYNDFDLEYCEYIRPGQREVSEYCRKLHRKKKEGDSDWREKKRTLLQKKKQLLLAP